MCRVNGLSVREYLDAIYARPLAAAIPAVLTAAALRLALLPGHNWFELLGAAGIIAATYFLVAVFVVLDGSARRQILLRLPFPRSAVRPPARL
jgi:hypothetical protein